MDDADGVHQIRTPGPVGHGGVARPTILAAGAVVWHGVDPRLALVHRPRYDDWSLPKGKVEPGEHLTTTAVREVLEETGVQGRLARGLGTVCYPTAEGPKQVHYWTMEATSLPRFDVGSEIDEVAWLPPDEAQRQVTQSRDADVIRRALALPLHTSTVLLVRHGAAGDRGDWPGPDLTRPLDALGEHQSARLTGLLKAFVPDQVLSAVPVRCTDTVGPLARACGVPLRQESWLGDQEVTHDITRAVSLVRQAAGRQLATVMCSQGNAIPALVAKLCDADGVKPAHVRIPCRKGSVWALSFAGQRLVDTEYFPDAEPSRAE